MDAALEQKLISSIDYWSHQVTKDNKVVVWDAELDSNVETQSFFYPTKQELIQIAWVKLLKPEVTARLENIWNQDGPRGIDKYVSVVVTNALIDFQRRQEVRTDEVLAVNLDQPLTLSQAEDGVNEDVGTVGDLVPGTTEGKAVSVDDLWTDLQEILTDQEFEVLQSWACGASVREIEQLQSIPKSTAHRCLARARAKAAQSVSDLAAIYNHIFVNGSGRKVKVYFPRPGLHYFFALRDRVVEYPQIQHARFGLGWILKATETYLLCDFPNWGRVELNPSGFERVSKIKPHTTSAVSPKTADILVCENQGETIPTELLCIQNEQPPSQISVN